jgi:hypothetical protein
VLYQLSYISIVPPSCLGSDDFDIIPHEHAFVNPFLKKSSNFFEKFYFLMI